MSFLFVDHILDLVPGKKTVGLKHVTLNDTYLTHFENKLALRTCIIGEALGQLCSWNVLKTSDYKFRPVGGVIQEIQMHATASVGDTILLESEIETLDDDMVSFSGRASVNDKTLLVVKNSLAPLMPLEEYNHRIKVQNDFEILYQPSAKIVYPKEKNNVPAPYYQIAYDKILSQENGKELTAQKKIASDASYFQDHFPKKPVFPLSLLMEYNLALAHTFVADTTGNKLWRPTLLKKVKIGNFVLPGDTVITRITLKEQTDTRFILNFHNAVDGKKVCVSEVEFGLG